MFTYKLEIFGLIITGGELAGLSALFLTVCIAFWRGGLLERRVTSLVAAAWVGSVLVDADASRGVQWAIFAVDVILAAWLLGEAIFGRRIWIAVAAAAQMMIVLTHIIFAVSPQIVQEGFFSAYYVWSYVVLFVIVVGSVLHRKAPATPGSEINQG